MVAISSATVLHRRQITPAAQAADQASCRRPGRRCEQLIPAVHGAGPQGRQGKLRKLPPSHERPMAPMPHDGTAPGQTLLQNLLHPRYQPKLYQKDIETKRRATSKSVQTEDIHHASMVCSQKFIQKNLRNGMESQGGEGGALIFYSALNKNHSHTFFVQAVS